MHTYESKIWWKRFFFHCSLAHRRILLVVYQYFGESASKRRRQKIKLWANATRLLIKGEGDINFLLDIAKDNTTIPIILIDDKGNINATKNLDSTHVSDTTYLMGAARNNERAA
jgi:hypothetical protein